jgi:phage FluMu protein gp41
VSAIVSPLLTAAETHDAAKYNAAREREAFARVRIAERYYARQLRRVADAIEMLVHGMAPSGVHDYEVLRRQLERYADILGPWARAVSKRLIAEVSRRDAAAWKRYGRLLGVELQREINEAPTGERLAQILDEQVTLITSLPLDAAKRVHELVR